MGAVVIQGFDVIDVLNFIATKNKKYQAIFLNDLERIVAPDSEEFQAIRKLYLDSQNNYTRSVLRVIFGDIEHLVK